MADNIITILLFGWPIILGLTIWLAKPRAAIDLLSRCDRAVLSFKERADRSSGYFAKYWRRPVSRVLLIPARSVDKIGEPFLRGGVKATLYPYTIAFIAIGTFIEAELLLLFGCFIAIFAVWGLFDRLNGAQSASTGMEIRRSKAAERQCPDCNSVKVNPLLSEGDGKCSVCHGTGEGGLLDNLADVTNPFGRQGTECFKCHGTGQCQTCGGNGVVYA